ncbi:MAG: hypothetical protein AAF517_07025 [Planctomycetota bacterium]
MERLTSELLPESCKSNSFFVGEPQTTLQLRLQDLVLGSEVLVSEQDLLLYVTTNER